VKGTAVEAATQQLTAAGLQVDVQNFAPGRKVRAQDPDTGASVPKGTKVTLFL
jgi:beta-lactam-binding protein with PASTA domain